MACFQTNCRKLIFMFHLSKCQITNKERTRKKYMLFLPKITESDSIHLDHSLYGSEGNNPKTIMKTSKRNSLLVIVLYVERILAILWSILEYF
jgi:predicted nucleic acid-binding Zn ribbon protein